MDVSTLSNNQTGAATASATVIFSEPAKNRADERNGMVNQMAARLVENHGFAAKKATRDALAVNTKIINIPVDERGSLLDVSA